MSSRASLMKAAALAALFVGCGADAAHPMNATGGGAASVDPGNGASAGTAGVAAAVSSAGANTNAGAGGTTLGSGGSSATGGAGGSPGKAGSGVQGGGGAKADAGGTGGDSGGPAVAYDPCPPKGTPCAIMPLGDSITAGAFSSNMSSYRGPLFHLALTHGQSIKQSKGSRCCGSS